MFIVWGKKLVYRRLGYVGHFCPICRAPRQFEVQRVGLAGHVYYITSGDGDLVRHERTCQECHTAVETDPAIYASFSKGLLPLAELTAKTYPNFANDLKDRLELEEKVRTTPAFLTPNERSGLIQQPFVLLSPKVEARLASFHFDVPMVLYTIGAIFLAPMLIGVLGAILPASVPPEYPVLAVGALALGIVIWQAIGTSRRFVNKQILPTLAKCLRPLKPTEAEMQGVLNELKKYKHKLGSKLKIGDLMEALRGTASS